ncbi:hypothetical protein AB0N09_15060 [Streptomyces erythrochromogenes]|uniref:hypothetical protein n=1 Tax=Streptomyces erythrochromogenes TaxID=285574 RepID=UPI003445D4D1
MRVLRALTVTAAACAVIGLSAPLASANQDPGGGRGGNGGGRGPYNVTVNPYAVHPGSTMQVSSKGCGRGGTVSSSAFGPDGDRDGGYRSAVFGPTNLSAGVDNFATVKINSHASPGTYTLAVKCNDSDLVATQRFQVLRGRGAQGGLGGSYGPSTPETVMGVGLLGAASLGAGFHLVRRRHLFRSRA